MDTSAKYGYPQVIFDGNSLTEKDGTGAEKLYRMPTTCSNTLYALPKKFARQWYGISGKQTSQLITDFPTKIAPYLRRGDIVCLWEITNDLGAGGVTAAQAYANIAIYSGLVRALGCKFVPVAMITRDLAGDAADLWTRGQATNALIAANPQIWDAYARPDLDVNFDAKADASNTTYYNADKIHLEDAGYDLVASYVATAIATLL